MTVKVPQAETQSAIPVGIEEIRAAARMLGGVDQYLPGQRRAVAVHTPTTYSESFSRQFGCNVHLKLENLQTTGSYKVRGSFNNIANLPPEMRDRGVVTASAGNHAQGVAAAARDFGIESRTTVFVPVGTPRVKQDNTRAYGVEVREIGENFDQAREAAYAEADASGRAFIEPFDDWHTIAGQGTVGLEIVEDLPTVRGIVAPVGGGGLISGIAIAVEAGSTQPRVIGVQAEGSRAMLHALEQGELTPLPHPPATQIADGIKVRQVGSRTLAVVQLLVGKANLVTVTDTEIVAAIADLMVYSKVMAEGAGAVGIAGLRNIQTGDYPQVQPFAPDDDVVVVISGGNIDPSFSWRILYEQTVPNLLALRVAIPDRPGELLRLLMPIAMAGVNIVDVDVNRLDARPRMGERIVEICVGIGSPALAENLLQEMKNQGYAVQVSQWVNPGDSAANLE